jgi:SAM-dependent methyltransferase
VEAGRPVTAPERRRSFHPEIEFGRFTDLDASITFYSRVQELLPADGVALDVGCGRGRQADDPVRVRREVQVLRGKCARVIGLDVDPVAEQNPFIDEFHPITEEGSWPVEDASIDLLLSDFVLEHVKDPDHFLSEAARVVKPGGVACLRTINVHSYMGLASRLVPNSLHVKVLGRAHKTRDSQDVFPTVYRCNTVRKLRRALERHGFDAAVYGIEGEPAYLAFSAPTYALGLLHRRLMPRRFQVGLFAWGRRR